MSARAQWALIVAVAALALGLGLAAGHWRASPNAPAGMTPERLYSATFLDLEGKPQALDRWRGRVLVVNFWATWCPPCRAEIPGFVRLQERFAPRGFSFVGIALDEREAVSDFARRFGINYPLLMGGAAGSDFAQALGSRGALPFSVVLDRRGRIVATHLGTLDEAELERLIAPLL